MDTNMAHLRTELSKDKKTIFVALPRALWRTALDGRCGCSWCKAHPDQPAMWDTMVIDATGKRDTSTCHYPELSAD